jgi:hypothetical protein
MNIGVTTSRRTKNSTPMVFELDIIEPPPSLVLLINPANLDIKYLPKITEQRVRWTSSQDSVDVNQNVGYVFQAHHDELDVLSATGKSAMFMSPSEGLTVKNRLTSVAYQNIEKLIAIYRNNGMNFNTKTNSRINPAKINSIGRVVITYNGFIYRGHFTGFTYSINETRQFNADFSFDFKVTQTLDIGQLLSKRIFQNGKTNGNFAF